jgi:hypothetical protein
MKKLLSLFCIAASFAAILHGQKTEMLRFMVETGNYTRINTPVSADLSETVVNDSVSLQLYEVEKGSESEVPCQFENGISPRLWWILSGTTAAGARREFVLYRTKNVSYLPSVVVENTGDRLRMTKNNKPVLDYQVSLVYPPEGIDTMYKRNAFIHPLYSPSGNILTRINPSDHYHHVGIWNSWTKVRIGDHVTDFWNLYAHQGTVRFAGINSIINGTVYGGFNVLQEHIDFQGKEPGKIAINEVWDVRVWDADPLEGQQAWLVDFASFLSVPGENEIILEAYRYGGGLGFRATAEWNNNNSWIRTSEGKTREDADGTRSRWTDAGGMFDGKGESGIVFLSHPSNREQPEPMRVWPPDQNKTGDVFFEFCPIRYRDWILKPGRTYRQYYRMLIYDGMVDKTVSERVWADFAFPPDVTIIKGKTR